MFADSQWPEPDWWENRTFVDRLAKWMAQGSRPYSAKSIEKMREKPWRWTSEFNLMIEEQEHRR